MRIDQRPLDFGFAAAGDHNLAAGFDDLVGRRQHEVDALLVNQTRHQREDRPARYRKPELLADIIRVGPFAFPIAGAELLRQLRAGLRIPALVDAVQYSCQLPGIGANPQQTLEPATELLRGDLARVGLADGGEVRGVDDATLEKGQFVVKFETVDMEGIVRRADPAQRLLWEEALIGEVMDGQDRGDFSAAPGEVGRRQRGLPVIDMHEVGCPILVQTACRKLGRRRRKPAEAEVVIAPVAAALVAVRVARPVIEFGAKQDVDR